MKKTDKSIFGTSFHFITIIASVEQLKKILGEPFKGTDGDHYRWNMETDDGNVFTIYDWAYIRPLEETEMIEWHIGASNEMNALKGKLEIKTSINNLK